VEDRSVRTIFVTGAEGFVGSHLVQHLRQRGFEVVGGVRNRGRKLALERRSGKAIVCDVSDAINVARAIASVNPDAVVHLAGATDATEANAEPLAAYQSIVSAWANVLDAVRRATPRARVLLVSAWDVYGNAGSDGRPVSENTPCQPVSTFGSLKAAAETIAHTFYQNYHLNLSIARPFPHFGAGQSERFFFAATARRVLDWNGGASGATLALPDLGVERDLLHVADVVTAYERILCDGQPNSTYNVCSGQARSCRSVVESMMKAANQTFTVSDQATQPGPTSMRTVCGDNSRLRNELNWQPTHTVDQAVAEMVSAFQRQNAAASVAN
jgi:GDP-4-dehydro-6-deoxy-D-mannose reductase